ncbi:IclR family transcriptional regulator [Metabacillus litoralis]|uniref:IclR family transcriptional regulator n=1 Tax=Metabacillus litoralis TaxID=152268 RepID=UPI00203B6000|nr:IclR family transcriptional regulator [Metabacillus litoralis]MCM3160621.1 IclR family transcriptional regulator [Metabacillus litoralis]
MKEKRDSSLANALSILKGFTMDHPEQGVTDVAKSLGVSKSTVHRLLASMASEGFVYKDPRSNRYSLGTSVLTLTNLVSSQLPILNESVPVLNMLTERTGESSHLGILEDHHMIYLQKVECDNPTSLFTHIGKRHPIHATSIGQVILAFQEHEVRGQLLPDKLEGYTNNTKTSHESLYEKLNLIKAEKHAVCVEELQEHVMAIAAPIFNEKGKVLAAINIVGPAKRMKSKLKSHRLIEEVIRSGEKMTELVRLRKSKENNRYKG